MINRNLPTFSIVIQRIPFEEKRYSEAAKCFIITKGYESKFHDGSSYKYLHCEDGPAIQWGYNGFEPEWYLDGELVRPQQMSTKMFLAYVKWTKDHERV